MTKKEKVSIEQINIKIGKEQIELTPEQANELKDLLNELLGSPEVSTVIMPSSPVVVPYPVYPRYRYNYWEVTRGSTDDNIIGEKFDGTITYCLSEK